MPRKNPEDRPSVYQFELPKQLKLAAQFKAEQNGIPIAPFMREAMRQFVHMDTKAFREYKKKHGPK